MHEYVSNMQIKDTDCQLLQWYLFEYSKLRVDTKIGFCMNKTKEGQSIVEDLIGEIGPLGTLYIGCLW